MVCCARPIQKGKTIKEPVRTVGSASLLNRYKAWIDTESIDSRIGKLEAQFGEYVQSMLRFQLKSKDIEVITKLSEASLQNIMTIQRLAKQIQEGSNET